MASDMNKHHEEKRSIELGITFLYELLTTKSDDYQEHLFVRLIDALGFKMPAAKSEKVFAPLSSRQNLSAFPTNTLT